MPEFPKQGIQYTQATPQVVNQPRMNLDAQTGLGDIWRQVSSLGGVVSDLGQKIQQGQDAMRLSILDRDYEDLVNDTLGQLEKVKTQEEADLITGAFEQKTAKLSEKDNDFVKQAYTIRLNQNIGNNLRTFKATSDQARAKDAHSQWQFSYSRALESGNLAGSAETAKLALDTGVIGQAEYDAAIKDGPADSLLAQARVKMDTNPEFVEKVLSDPEIRKKFTGKQLELSDDLLYKIGKLNKANIEDRSQKYWQLLQKGDYESLRTDLNDPSNPLPVEKEGGKNWWQNLIQKKQEDLAQTDLREQAKIADTIIFEPTAIDPQQIRNRAGLGIHGGLSLDKAKEYQEKYSLMADKNSALNTPLARTMFNELKNAQQDRSFSIEKEQNDVRYGQSLDSLSDYFINYRKKNGKDPTLAETQEFYNNLVSGYRTPERPFTDAKIQQTLGELQSGGSVSVFGTVMPFSRPEDAVNHMLRNLGPNWQKMAPEAAEIIKQKWPDAKIDVKQTLPAKQGFEVGDTKIMPNGRTYKYTGLPGDAAWKLVK